MFLFLNVYVSIVNLSRSVDSDRFTGSRTFILALGCLVFSFWVNGGKCKISSLNSNLFESFIAGVLYSSSEPPMNVLGEKSEYTLKIEFLAFPVNSPAPFVMDNKLFMGLFV